MAMKRDDEREIIGHLIREEEKFIEAKAKDGRREWQGLERPENSQHSSVDEQDIHKECEYEIRELKKKLMSADMSHEELHQQNSEIAAELEHTKRVLFET